MKNLQALQQLLASSPKRMVITMHYLPDADALGSSLALAAFLKKKHHQVTIISPTNYPDFLTWMEGSKEVLIFEEAHQEKYVRILQAADLIFCLDFSVLHRIHAMASVVRHAAAKVVVIDHHLGPEDFADMLFWDTKASSTAEMVYRLIEGLGGEALLDQGIAECLYAGIMTDTGCFKYPNTTSHTHRIAAALMDIGVEVDKISRQVYDNYSQNRLQFLSFAIAHRLVVLEAYKTAYFAISASDFQKFDLKIGDTEGIVNYALSLKGIIFAAFITEKKDGIRISLRSIGSFPVHTFAKAHFAGGGHRNAAGGNSDLTLAATVEKFEYLVKQNQATLSAHS